MVGLGGERPRNLGRGDLFGHLYYYIRGTSWLVH